MEEKEIDVNDYIDVSAILKQLDIENAKQLLKSNGYNVFKNDCICVHKNISREVLENIFVTAIEGGSNYWYYLSNNAVKLIRKAVPKDEEPYLAIAILKAVLDHNVSVPISDAEDEELEVIGYLSKETMNERLQKLADSDDSWALHNELNDNMDASSSDVVFQYLVMGEVVYG